MSAPHSPAELQRLYEKGFTGKSEYRDTVWRVLVDEYFARWLPAGAGATVLDLGCGHCEFINNVRVEKRFGMDLNPDTVRQAAPGVRILAQSCSQPWLGVQIVEGEFRSTHSEVEQQIREDPHMIANAPARKNHSV